MLALNVVIAFGLVLFTGFVVVRNWYSPNDQGLPVRWWSLPVIVFSVGLVVVRLLRSVVVVHSRGLTKRTVGYTAHYAWRELREVAVSTTESGRARLRATVPSETGSRHYLEIVVRKDHRSGTPFATAVQRAIEYDTASPSAVEHEADRPTFRGSPRWTTYGMWISLAVIVIGSQVFEGALRDREAYDARAARDRVTTASVTRSRIVEHDDGENDPTYSTRVGIVFDAVDEHVNAVIERQGRYRYPIESAVEIVYDSAHPRDADFSDRPNRSANESSARLRLWVGPALVIVCALVGAALFLVSRRGVTPRTREPLRERSARVTTGPSSRTAT
jgi:hypothetical protein